MTKIFEFENKCLDIFNNFNINKIIWSQSTPIEEDLVYEINIISIDDKKYDELDELSKLAWKSFFKLIPDYNQEFGNNVEISLTKDEISVTEIMF